MTFFDNMISAKMKKKGTVRDYKDWTLLFLFSNHFFNQKGIIKDELQIVNIGTAMLLSSPFFSPSKRKKPKSKKRKDSIKSDIL